MMRQACGIGASRSALYAAYRISGDIDAFR